MDSILNYLEDFIPNSLKNQFEIYNKNITALKDLKNSIPPSVEECINLSEIERIAFSKLDLNALSYYMSGANDEITLKRNQKFFNKIFLNSKAFVNVSEIDLQTEILGNKISLPICISPSALQKMAHEDGELATARAALKNDTVMVLSTLSSTSLEEVSKENKNGIKWFQLYPSKNRMDIENLLKEIEKNNFTAIMLTVDNPIVGHRDRDHQVGFKIPKSIQGDVHKVLGSYLKDHGRNLDNTTESDAFEVFRNNLDSRLTWEIITWLRTVTKLPIILKGILNPQDAIKAAEYNVDAIIISNHGGRQLDTVPSTIEVLERINFKLEEFYKLNPSKKKLEVYIDGGFRRGTDILKALALGAKAVFLGRPIIWGLAAGGEQGINKVFDILKSELSLAMKLTGCTKISEIDKTCIYNRKELTPKF